MKAVARLVWLYVAPTPLLGAATLLGFTLMVTSAIILMNPALKEAVGDVALWLPMVGIGTQYVGSALMPLLFGRLARGHAIHTLPFSRIRLLASFFVVLLSISALAPLFWLLGNWELANSAWHSPDPVLLAQTRAFLIQAIVTIYSSACLLSGWLYLTLWLATSQRGAGGLAKGFVVLLFALYGPVRAIQTLESSALLNLVLLAVVWGSFSAAFLWWPRLRARVGSWSSSRFLRLPDVFSVRRVVTRDVDIFLGTSQPWLIAGALALPMLVAGVVGNYTTAFLFFYINIFGVVSGTISGQAAERSRALWLRTRWSRRELFGQVERAFWRHNARVLGVAALLTVFFGFGLDIPLAQLAVGVAPVFLGTALSTYLGLMLTRGMHFFEALLGVVVMLGLMGLAVVNAAGMDSLATLVAVEAVMLAAAIALRFVARSRWSHIDWTVCRPTRAGLGRVA